MPQQDSAVEIPNQDEIRAALRDVVGSPVFRSSPQLAAFLTFVVGAVLDGKRDRIKGYTIGVEVLRRDTKFDPQTDPIVRVEATRLRRALDRYYNGPGQADAVLIGLLPGSYIPTFTRRSRPQELPTAIENLKPAFRRLLWPSAIGLAAAVLMATWLAVTHYGSKSVVAGNRPTDSTQLRQGNGMPTLLVQDFETTGIASPNALSARALQEHLRDAFAHFDSINIATKTPSSNAIVNYRLQGFIEYADDGTTRVRVRLFDADGGTVVWTSTFVQQAATDRKNSEDSIVVAVASTLLQPFGIIRSRERTKHISGSVGDPRYGCELLAADAFRSYDPDEQAQARSCLERMIALDPSYASGYSYLAALLQRERVYRIGSAANDPSALDNALRLAQRGIELRPDSARAWHVLGIVLFARKDSAAGVAALEKGVKLNPYDLLISSGLGGRLISIGEIDRGMKILRETPDYGGPRPSFDRFSFFLGHYMRNELADAAREADEMTSDNFTFGLFSRTIMAAAKGDIELAKLSWSKLVALRTEWRSDPRSELERFISSPAILDRLIQDLRSARLIEN